MVVEKKLSFKPIMESKGGVHLTCYLEKRASTHELSTQLSWQLEEAKDCLEAVMSEEQAERLLEPLESLAYDPAIFAQITGNIGLFRNAEGLRILNIPSSVEDGCHVASSFHIKPLLTWLQNDREFLILGLEQSAAHLYLANQSLLRKVDTLLLSEVISPAEGFARGRSTEGVRLLITHLNQWLTELTRLSAPVMFLVGPGPLESELAAALKYRNRLRQIVGLRFSDSMVTQIGQQIRQIMADEARQQIVRELSEFRCNESSGLLQKNIFQISQSAVAGRVRKLVISSDFEVFGKINEKTGELAVHPFDLDHEDDDILDDLAQIVLKSGGEVVLLPRKEIPSARPALALLQAQSGERIAKPELRSLAY